MPELDPALYDLHADALYPLDGLLSMPHSPSHATGEDIQRHLERTYSSTLAVELSHLPPAESSFLSSLLESTSPSSSLTPSERRNAHSLLLQSHSFDHFMSIKYPTTKRYSLEGAEALLPLLDAALTSAASTGTRQVILAMPHRGRLNVLTSLMDYPARALFAKVQGRSLVPDTLRGDCDVLSHVSATTTKPFASHPPLTISLLPNPSHLEAVDPVALGRARAEQDLLRAKGMTREEQERAVLCVQVHGDAAFAGQGVVAETLALSLLDGFRTGGSVHVVVNNQLGFTAGEDRTKGGEGYVTDVGKVVGAPVLHVNGDDVDAVMWAGKVAVAYRQRFAKDVIIDLVTFRRWGHNEVDEPRFTQPLMYSAVAQHPTVTRRYGQQLQEAGLLKPDSVERVTQRLTAHLEAELAASGSFVPSAADYFQGQWTGYQQASHCYDHVSTGVDAAVLREVALASVALRAGFDPHPRLRKTHVDARVRAVREGVAIDWATAEAMALGSLLREGWDVRMSGQDVERGTFSHRHAVLVDQSTGHSHVPFHHAAYPGHASFISSNLSEFAVLGFEYGHSVTSPHCLVVWEAQFGDFANVAQPVIDTFISSGESKWLKSSGLVLLLPHGQDATGPEHVTARIERFLQLSDDDPTSLISSPTPARPVNIIVANPSTPSQYFHLLRRQMLRPYRKPLVIASPKNLLRHSEAVSPLSAMEAGSTFQSVIGEEVRDGVEVLVLCSGRVYYELKERRTRLGKWGVALVRVEELSPFPWLELRRQLRLWEGRAALREVRWFQEEPRNAGAWSFVRERVDVLLAECALESKQLRYVGRRPLPAAAVGSVDAHNAEVEDIYKRIFQ